MAGVYISYPFCAQKCSFCNFASGIARAGMERAYVDALVAEIRRNAWTWKPETLYVGGGTPSRLAIEDLARVLEAVPGHPWIEATIEAAPGTITPEKAAGWRRCGIDRVSLGVQSFVPRELAHTGRRHTAEMVASEMQCLGEAGIQHINIDLIAGLPFQTLASWRESLDQVEYLGPDHVSIYMLEVDEDSRLGLEILCGGTRYGAANAPSDDLIAELYEYAVERLRGLGLERYEISNFSRAGCESHHNLKYWLLEPYVGFGADAHSFDGEKRRQNVEGAEEYIARGGDACASEVPADPGERLMVGLRLTRGIEMLPSERRAHEASLRRFADAGLVESEGAMLRLTARGVLLANEVFQEFVPCPSPS